MSASGARVPNLRASIEGLAAPADGVSSPQTRGSGVAPSPRQRQKPTPVGVAGKGKDSRVSSVGTGDGANHDGAGEVMILGMLCVFPEHH